MIPPEFKRNIRAAIGADLNVLVQGVHGCGKTAVTKQVCNELGLRLKYYSTATLDPYADLVGIPFPHTDDDGRKVLVYHQSPEMLDADVIFFDEFNRCQAKVENACLEIIDTHTLNGTPLPNLRCVIAAINPPNGKYKVSQLDPATVSRFDCHVEVEAEPCASWFTTTYEDLGRRCVAWWHSELTPDEKNSVPPRSLEKIAKLLSAGLSPKELNINFSTLPVDLIQTTSDKVPLEEFLRNPTKYAGAVTTSLEVAKTYCQYVQAMTPSELFTTRDVMLALPAEVLNALVTKVPDMPERLRSVILSKLGKEESDVYDEMLRDAIM